MSTSNQHNKWLNDMFGRKILPGQSFMRIEQKMGGSDIRFYFLAAFLDDGRIQVQEYGGSPRAIKVPSPHQSTLMLLTEDLLTLSGFVPPTIDQVVAQPKKKASASDTLKI